MEDLTKKQAAGREKTLLTALLLSMWAPLTTGIAVVMSTSTTQLADFIRRSVELFALFVSWWVFRRLQREKELDTAQKARMEKIAGLCVAIALCFSGIVMLGLTLSRLDTFKPGGNVYLGLTIAVLGLITNGWFWRRYTNLTLEHYNSVIDTQRQLYRAKAFVDLCIIIALTAVAVNPAHPVTRYIDLLGSVAVAGYLLWSGLSTVRTVKLAANFLPSPSQK